MEIHGTRGIDSFLASEKPSSLNGKKEDEWEKIAEDLERLRTLTQASDTLDTSEIFEPAMDRDQALPGEIGQEMNPSSLQESNEKEASDPVKLAAYLMCTQDFLDAMKVSITSTSP